MNNGQGNPQVLQANAVTITAQKVIVGEEPAPPDPNARRRYIINALIVFALAVVLLLWTTGHIEPFAGRIAAGGITLWALGSWAASFSSKLLPKEEAQRRWLGHWRATVVLAIVAIPIGLAALFTRSLYVKLGDTDARRVRIEVREENSTKNYLAPLALSDIRPSAGRPFFSGFGTKRLTLTPTEPKGYHPEPIEVGFLESWNVRFPDQFDRIPIVRVLPIALVLPAEQNKEDVKLHVCSSNVKWELPAFKNRPLYFGARDVEVARAVAKRTRGEEFSLEIRDHLALLGMKEPDMPAEVAMLRTVHAEPFDVDLTPGQDLIVALTIAGKSVACKPVRADGEITTLFLERTNTCIPASLQQCVSPSH